MGEWSLVLFTILAQASIGMMIVSQFISKQEQAEDKKVMIWVIGLMAASMLVSLAHLGSPMGAYRAIFNIASSWLSREIFFASSFLAFAVLTYYFRASAAAGAARLTGIAASVCGALTLISMASIYVNTAVSSWNSFYTHISFYTTAAVTGAVTYMSVIYRVQPDSKNEDLRYTFGIAAAGVALQLVSLLPYLAALSGGPAAAQASAELMAGMAVLLVASQGGAIIGGMYFTFKAWGSYINKGSQQAGGWLSAALVTVFAAEIAGRYLFYASGIHVMLGKM